MVLVELGGCGLQGRFLGVVDCLAVNWCLEAGSGAGLVSGLDPV